ncbi:MAG TPA: TonB-dependent siderophore receptor [Burkholderiales bacterium]|nr:TonB-dependent siderophore receptor [Burkholderiales bacterium]
MPQFRCRPLAAAILLVFSAPVAHGQAQTDTAAQSQPETTLPEVKVRTQAERADGPVTGYRAERSGTFTRTDTPLKEVPASVSVVPRQMMKDAGMQSMGDVFRYVPGVLMHQGEGNRDQIVLRGNSTTADFYVDGVRDDAQVFRDLYNLERVEVLKGPAGMAFGRGGAGGVVNRVTKRPVFGAVGEVNLSAGSWNQYRGTLDVGNKLNDAAAWRLAAMYENSDSFRNGFNLERYAANPTLTMVLGAQTALTVGYEHLWDYRTADRGFPSFNGAPFNADPATFFGNADQSHARSVVDGAYATIEHDFGGGLQLRNTLRATHYDKYYQNVFPGSAVNAVGNLTLSAYNNANKRTNFFNQTDLIAKFSAGGFEHTLLVGAELGHQNSDNKRNTGFFGPGGAAIGAVVPAANPFAVATAFRPNGTDADNNVTADIAAAYVQDQVAFSPYWKMIAGLRYDRFKVDFDDRRTTTPAVDLSRTDRDVSPRIGVIWTPTAASAYYVSYSYAFLPSGEQLNLATNTADLEPETAKNYEVGARWDLRPGLTLSTAVFRTDRNNVRVNDPLNPGFFVKTGQQRTEGLEIGLQGEIARYWQVYGGYAYLDGRVLSPVASGGAVIPAGNKIGLVPENTFSLWNKVDLVAGWSAGLGLIYQGESFTSFNNTVRLPAFTRVDGALFYTLEGGRTRLAFNVENIFDRKYFPTVDGDNNISPGAPRNVRVTLSMSF